MKKREESRNQEEVDALCPECGHAFKTYVDRIVPEDRKSEMKQKMDCPVCGCGDCNVVQPGT